MMNQNQKKKLMFVAMGNNNNNAGTSVPTVSRGSNNKSSPDMGSMFRSVSMGVSEPPALFTRSTLPLAKSHSSPFPAVCPSPPPPVGKSATPFSIPPTPSTPPAITPPFSANVDVPDDTAWVWNVTPQLIQPVPMYHPLEHTAVVISDIPLDTIAARISTFLKQQSIPARYSDDGRVSCVTDSLLKFVIQLWQTNHHNISPTASPTVSPITTTTTTNNNNNNKTSVVIEIQRRQGCCVAMQAMRHRLMEAIYHGTNMDPRPPPSRSTCRFVQDLLETAKLPPPPSHLTCGKAALNLVYRLLESDRLDSQRLGLESLVSLTNPSLAILTDADEVSKEIVSNDQTWHPLLSRYFQPPTSTSFNMNNNINDSMDNEYYAAVHLLALKALTQSVESLWQSSTNNNNNNNNNTTTITSNLYRVDLTSDFWKHTLESMYWNLCNASNRPLEAAWSIRCFRILQAMQPDDMARLLVLPNKLQLEECLKGAYDFGKLYNRSLETETIQWMGRLGIVY